MDKYYGIQKSPPTLKEILAHRNTEDSKVIHVSPVKDYNTDTYTGLYDECPDEILDLHIQAWSRHDGIYLY